MLAHTPVGLALFDAQDFRLLDMNTAYSSLLDTFLASGAYCVWQRSDLQADAASALH